MVANNIESIFTPKDLPDASGAATKCKKCKETIKTNMFGCNDNCVVR